MRDSERKAILLEQAVQAAIRQLRFVGTDLPQPTDTAVNRATLQIANQLEQTFKDFQREIQDDSGTEQADSTDERPYYFEYCDRAGVWQRFRTYTQPLLGQTCRVEIIEARLLHYPSGHPDYNCLRPKNGFCKWPECECCASND